MEIFNHNIIHGFITTVQINESYKLSDSITIFIFYNTYNI